MNGYLTGTRESGKSWIYRRLLPAVCAVCLAGMQCFLLLPAVSAPTFAKSSVSLEGTALGYDGNDVTVEKSVSGDIGPTLADLLDAKGVPVSEVDSVEFDSGDSADSGYDSINVEKRDGSYWVWFEDEDPEEAREFSSISFRMSGSYSPVTKISINADETMESGSTMTLKYGSGYNVKGDAFFKEDGFARFIEWSIEGAKDASIGDKSVKITAGEAGTEITLALNSINDSDTATISVKASKLTVSPSKVTLKVGGTQKCTVKDSTGKLSNSDLTWKSSNTKIATVSKGTIKGVKAGKATITVTSNAESSKGMTAKVSVTVQQPTTTTTRSTYTPYRPTTGTPVTGTTAPLTTAPRPEDTTGETIAPSFQTITVKEVILSAAMPDPTDETVYYDENGNPIEGDETEPDDFDEDGVTFPAAAGSAAVAVAACSAGAVGRVRRFRSDMGTAAAAAVIGAAADGGKRRFRRGGGSAEVKPDAADAKTADKESKNPLRRFRK